MQRTTLLARLFLACFLVLASACKSEAPSKPSEEATGARAQSVLEMAKMAADGSGELTAQPKVSLAAAIAQVQRLAPEERFMHAELWLEKTGAQCLLVFKQERLLHALLLDAESGEILEQGPIQPGELSLEGGTPPIAPARAIELALAQIPHTFARALSLEFEDSAFVYHVSLFGDGQAHELWLSGTTGAMLPEPASKD